MTLAQGAIRGVLHNEERDAIYHVVFQDAHNRGMLQVGDGTCFFKKVLFILVSQSHLEHFDCSRCVEIYMLAKVDISEASLPKLTDQAVVSKLLTYAVWHRRITP